MQSYFRFFQMIWLFLLFMGCTLLFYYGILWVSDEYKEYHRYDEPQGRSMKVVSPSSLDVQEEWLPIERLRLFLVDGE
ncbi:YqzK family protein [Salipaludibacillus daqingensis]|uniref:YqzK family protein n=1 Tax=Salipaludibacillus daqingensis TaxID=3041001 RepID=UPI0024735912|nr:YqzK family protein [Salipaludibacillus daqingensis]